MSLVGSLASLTQITLPPRLSNQFSASLKRFRLLLKLTSRKRPLTESEFSMKPLKRLPMLLKPSKTPLRPLKQLMMPYNRLNLTQKKLSPIRYSPIRKLLKPPLQWLPLRLLSIRQQLTLPLLRPQTQVPPKS